LAAKQKEEKQGAIYPVSNETELVYWRHSKSDVTGTVEEPPTLSKVMKTNVSLPLRQYYRNMTFKKMGISEWLFNIDPKDNVDEQWQSIVDGSVRTH